VPLVVTTFTTYVIPGFREVAPEIFTLFRSPGLRDTLLIVRLLVMTLPLALIRYAVAMSTLISPIFLTNMKNPLELYATASIFILSWSCWALAC